MLTGKRVAVTGTAQGIGEAAARCMASGGPRAMLVEIDLGRAESVAVYGTSKAAILMLTKCMAADHAVRNVDVNHLCPGVIDKELNRQSIRGSGDIAAACADEVARTALGRLGTAHEGREVIAFMASEHAGSRPARRSSPTAGLPCLAPGVPRHPGQRQQ